jgi:uncharacterized protein with HEPN domain
MKDIRLLLDDLIARIDMIEMFTAGGREAFMTSLKVQDSVIRCYEMIGEIVRRLPSESLLPLPEHSLATNCWFP